MRLLPDHRSRFRDSASSAVPAAVVRRRGQRIRLAAGAALVIALVGCTQGPASVSAPAPAAPQTPSAPATEPSATDPGGGAAAAAAATEALKQAVTATLTGLAAGSPKPATAQVTEALTAAGIPLAVLEVSQSRTPTGLEADAIEAAVLQGSDCVIGQVREGTVTVTVLPVLASGKCFVGS